MKPLPLKDLLVPVKGQITQGLFNPMIKHVTTNQVNLKSNTLFINRKRAEINKEAWRNCRSCAILTDQLHFPASDIPHVTIVKVNDIEQAYWAFIDLYRGQFDLPVIGVTGTCGKSTIKEMVKQILSKDYRIQGTYLSNNGINLNLSYLLGIEENTEAAVFEMGVAYPGNLKTSCRYFRPGIGVIANIGIDHLHGCKTIEGYRSAKAEMLEGLGNKGTLVLNADDEQIALIDLSAYKGKVWKVGTRPSADFQISRIRAEQGTMNYTLTFAGKSYLFSVPGYSDHDVFNAAAAIAAVYAMGMEVKAAGERLRTFRHLERHLEVVEGMNGCKVIDDTWSSNPTSAEAALKTAKRIAGEKKLVGILGHMGQLGAYSTGFHRKIGERAAELGFDLLVAVGAEAKPIAQGALAKGMDSDRVFWCRHQEEAHNILEHFVDKETIVLVKASMESSMKLLLRKIRKQDN